MNKKPPVISEGNTKRPGFVPVVGKPVSNNIVTDAHSRFLFSAGSGLIYDSTTGTFALADVATATVFYRKTAGTGAPETQTLATLKTDLGLTGTNSGDQTITLTGDVTGSGTGSFAATLADTAVTPGSYGSASSVGTFTVDQQGRQTAAASVAIAISSAAVSGLATVATSGSFSDLSNKPGFKTNGQAVASATLTLGSTEKGAHILLTTSGITVTFPSSGYASGEGVLLSNVSGGNVTFAFPGGSDMGTTFPNNASIIALCDGGGFWRQYCYSTARL